MSNIRFFKVCPQQVCTLGSLLQNFAMCPLVLHLKYVFVVKQFFARCPFLLRILHVGEGELPVNFDHEKLLFVTSSYF